MTGRSVVWFVVGVAVVGTIAASVSFAPTAALFSDASTFEDNTVGADDEIDRISVEATAPKTASVGENATLEITLENDGAGPAVAEYEIVVDEPVESESVVLEGGEAHSSNHGFDTADDGEIYWEVTANGDTVNGTLNVTNDSAEMNATSLEGTSIDDSETIENETGTQNDTDGNVSTSETSSENDETIENNDTATNNGTSTTENTTDGSQDGETTGDGGDETESTSGGSAVEAADREHDV